MRRFFTTTLLLLSSMFFACSENDNKQLVTETSLSDIQRASAIKKAHGFMRSEGVVTSNPEWSATGIITEAYPFTWLNYEMWYLVNYGWGNKREWICVDAQYGSNTPERKNTGNLYIR